MSESVGTISALDGRRAVVTGASGGVGRAVALALADGGATVICVARDAERLRDVVAACGGRARAEPADLSDAASLAGLAERLAGEDLDILVNNAGHDRGGNVRFDQESEADIADKLAVNLAAAMRLAAALLPGFLARNRADIVNIGSVVTRRPSPGLAAYAATKHGLHGFSEGLRADYADTNLRVTEIIPGVIRSGFAARRWDGDEARSEAFYAGFGSCLSPEDVARAVIWALSQPPGVSVDEILLRPIGRSA